MKITRTRLETILSLYKDGFISKSAILACCFPSNKSLDDDPGRCSAPAPTLLEEFLVDLERPWVGLASDLFDHLRELYPDSKSPQLASPRALGWAIRDWMEAGDPRISKKRTSAGQQYTLRPIDLRPVEHKSEQCSSGEMLTHTLESTSFDIPHE